VPATQRRSDFHLYPSLHTDYIMRHGTNGLCTKRNAGPETRGLMRGCATLFARGVIAPWPAGLHPIRLTCRAVTGFQADNGPVDNALFMNEELNETVAV
jgi:hypothetical protein